MRFNAISAIRCTVLGLLVVITAGVTSAGEPSSKDVVIREHAAAEHGEYFALAVRPTFAAQKIKRHIVVVDTSASQIGTVRESGLAIMKEVLAKLPAQNEVQIMAVDLESTALSNGFVPVKSNECQAAVVALEMRTPLGTTDLAAALKAISDASDGSQAISALYIGDGISSNRISNEEMKNLVDQLVGKNISVHSLVAGPRTSLEIPGVLANLTGGTVDALTRGEEKESAATFAMSIQRRPLSVNTFRTDGQTIKSVGRSSVFLRPDRHTVIMGEGSVPEFQSLTCSDSTGATITWTASQVQRKQTGAELVHLVDRSRNSDGIHASVADLSQLEFAASEFARSMQESISRANYLARRGHTRDAREVLDTASRMDNSNKQVKLMLTSLALSPVTADETAPAAVVQPPQPGNGITIGSDAGEKQDPLSDMAENVRLQSQILAAETDAVLDQARLQSAEDPDYATGLLKGILETIESSADVSPDVRIELKRRVVAAIGEVQSRVEINALRRRQIARDQAVKEAQKRLLQEDIMAEKRLAIQIEKIRGLLQRGRQGDFNAFEDAEYEARITLDERPGNGPATQALVMSEALGQLDKVYRLVNLRHDRFLEVLYQVELSHVPFPDEPPIQYPPADVWRALTLTRKPRYESTDLRTEAPVEKWLRKMLDKPVRNLDFPGDTPLSEILSTIETYFTATYGAGVGASGTDFKMTIYPDAGELGLVNIDSLEDVIISDINFDGMSLRNALKLIFDQTNDDTKSPEPLTYIIQNEVMMITSKTKAESAENVVTRVYPVADLAISPSVAQQLGGGGLGGGGFGGQGGGFGGQGGGFGGQGGGFGGQGGGFGGGFQSIPPEKLNSPIEGGIHFGGLKAKKK